MPIEVKNYLSGIRRDRKSWPTIPRKGAWVAAALAPALLTGCTTFPPSPDATGANVNNITGAILTELYCAAGAIDPNYDFSNPDSNPPNPPFKPTASYFSSPDDWIALVDLYLSAQIEGSVSPAVSLLGPFNPAKAVPTGGSTGTFTAAFGASFDQTRTNLREYKI